MLQLRFFISEIPCTRDKKALSGGTLWGVDEEEDASESPTAGSTYRLLVAAIQFLGVRPCESHLDDPVARSILQRHIGDDVAHTSCLNP